jgi:hypothetical protein
MLSVSTSSSIILYSDVGTRWIIQSMLREQLTLIVPGTFDVDKSAGYNKADWLPRLLYFLNNDKERPEY